MRRAEIKRKTTETYVAVKLNIDGSGKGEISTGIGFFDHMLTLLKVHSGFDMTVTVTGDLQVDMHHTVEDTAICLGKAVCSALGDKRGIERYASELLIMDDSVVEVAVDLGGRSSLIYDVRLQGNIGTFDSELIKVFLDGLTKNLLCNLYVTERVGANKHHTAEAIFKALARCLKQAARLTGTEIPSSKGSL